MRKSSKYFLQISLIVFFILFSSTAAFADIDPSCDPLDPDCPIDGGVSLLIAAGIGLGVKKAYIQNKKNP